MIQLKTELAQKSSIYSDQHPDVRSLKRKIRRLTQTVQAKESESQGASAASSQTVAVARVKAKIDAAEERQRSMTLQLEDLKQKRKKLDEQIIRTPQVQRALASLNRDFESTL